jgi:hypothetical protein
MRSNNTSSTIILGDNAFKWATMWERIILSEKENNILEEMNFRKWMRRLEVKLRVKTQRKNYSARG